MVQLTNYLIKNLKWLTNLRSLDVPALVEICDLIKLLGIIIRDVHIDEYNGITILNYIE